MPELTAGLGQGWVYAWYAVVFALLITVLDIRSLSARLGDYRGVLLYFALFFALLALLPSAAALRASPDGLRQLALWGVTLGRIRTGLLLLAAFIPFAVIVLVVAARDVEVSASYPFANSALYGGTRFVYYELAYLLFYYTAWEFCFRGVLFLPLVPAIGLVPALGVQTALSTVYHIGRPRAEIWLSVIGGLFFGAVAYLTGSVLYTILMHAVIGVGVDSIQWWRARRAATA